MCFDRNINGNRDVKFLEWDYLTGQRSMKLTLVALSRILDRNWMDSRYLRESSRLRSSEKLNTLITLGS